MNREELSRRLRTWLNSEQVKEVMSSHEVSNNEILWANAASSYLANELSYIFDAMAAMSATIAGEEFIENTYETAKRMYELVGIIGKVIFSIGYKSGAGGLEEMDADPELLEELEWVLKEAKSIAGKEELQNLFGGDSGDDEEDN